MTRAVAVQCYTTVRHEQRTVQNPAVVAPARDVFVGGERLPRAPAARLLGDRGAQRQPAETRLEQSRVRGGKDRRLPDVVPQSQMAAQRRDRQCRVAPAQIGRVQSPAAQNRQVSGREKYFISRYNYYTYINI